MVEGVHFLPDQDLVDVAWKLVATNLSDLAAKGAKPLGALLSHTLGVSDDGFVAGLGEALSKYEFALLGGDTVSCSGPRTFGMTAIGTATHQPVPSRSGAQLGDVLYITGSVGAAMIGFEALRDGLDADTNAYRRPIPLLTEGQALASNVSAIMDVSDGVLLDASRIATASKVTISIDTAKVPIATSESRRNDALRWGDDYQLLFTANRDVALPVAATAIGTVLERSKHPLLIDNNPPEPGDSLGYSH